MACLCPHGRLWPGRKSVPERLPRALSAGLLSISLLTTLLLPFLVTDGAAAAPPPGPPSAIFEWPVTGPVLVPFRAARSHYGEGGHAGIDIGVPRGTPVRACADGRVAFSGGTPSGICVTVAHQGGLKTTYVGLAASNAAVGALVRRGALLGTADGTADRSSRQPHLHLGAHLNGTPVDPLLLLRGAWDPSDCLFLGPSGLAAAPGNGAATPRGGLWSGIWSAVCGVAGAAKDGLCALGGALAAPFRGAGRLLAAGSRHLSGGIEWLAGKAGSALGACGRLLRAAGRGIARAASWVLSLRIVQALLAGLAACIIVCTLIVSVALILGVSFAVTVASLAAGIAGCLGYAVYYALSAGDSFDMLRCFEGCLLLGGASAGVTLLGGYLGGFIGAGFGRIGVVGAAKNFLINGTIDAGLHSLLARLLGGRVSLAGVLFSFFAGGAIGAAGHLFMAGYRGALLSPGVAGGAALAETAAGRALVKAGGLFAQRLPFMAASGCASACAASLLRIIGGAELSLSEGLVSFAGGFIMGGFSLACRGGGLPAILARLTRGRVVLRSEFLRALLSDLAGRVLQPALERLRAHLARPRRRGALP